MVLKRSQRIVGKVAAALGIIQGLVGIALPLFVNILHYSTNTITFSDVEYLWNLVESAIYKLFIRVGGCFFTVGLMFDQFLLHKKLPILSKKSAANKSQFASYPGNYLDDSIFSQDAVLGPKNFVIIMWLYIFLSVVWFVISVSQYIAIHNEEDNQAMHMGMWAMITMVICLFDVINIGLLVDNYVKCRKHDNICILAVGTVIGLVARGWTLWFVNLIFSYILLIIAKNQTKGMPWFEQTIRIPRARIQHNDDVKTKSTSFSVFSVFAETAPRSPTFLQELERKNTPSPRSPAIRSRSFSNQGSRFTY